MKLVRPRDAIALFVCAHGAGAPMDHPFLASMAAALAREKIATLRFNFPYADQGKRRPDPKPLLEQTILAAMMRARRSTLPLLAGGKSMGGRITSLLAARGELDVRGLVFLGYPLHPARKPATTRAEHLPAIAAPMLFLQGTRDTLADLTLLRPIVAALPDATLHEIPEGDHSFAVPKRTGRTEAAIHAELAAEIARFARRIC